MHAPRLLTSPWRPRPFRRRQLAKRFRAAKESFAMLHRGATLPGRPQPRSSRPRPIPTIRGRRTVRARSTTWSGGVPACGRPSPVCSGLCWSPALNLLAAVSNSGSGNRVMTSPDGVNWTSRSSAADNSWFSVCWAQGLGLFAAFVGGKIGQHPSPPVALVNQKLARDFQEDEHQAAAKVWSLLGASARLGFLRVTSGEGALP